MRFPTPLFIGLLIVAPLVPGSGTLAAQDSDAVTGAGGSQALQPGEDSCPSLPEDPDGVDDLDGCPDTDVSISAAMDEAYTLSVYTVETRTVEIWIQNGNYPADILVHALSVSTVGACEVSLIAEPGDGVFPHTTDEDGDTILETYFYLLEWDISLDAGESYYTTRDYEVVCSLLGEHSFEMQVDAVPWPPVVEEDVEDLPNVHKHFPLLTVIDHSGLDSDGDGFSDSVEAFVGTDPSDPCANTSDPNDEADDRWPADLNDDQISDIEDMTQLTPPFFNTFPPDPNYGERNDFNGDGVIDIEDVTRLTPPTFNQVCVP
jgi:hypothetical protein